MIDVKNEDFKTPKFLSEKYNIDAKKIGYLFMCGAVKGKKKSRYNLTNLILEQDFQRYIDFIEAAPQYRILSEVI